MDGERCRRPLDGLLRPGILAGGELDDRGRALAAVKADLVDLYWRVGEYISRKLETAA